MRLTGIFFYYFLGLKCFPPILNRDVFEILYYVSVEEKNIITLIDRVIMKVLSSQWYLKNCRACQVYTNEIT